MQGAFTVKSSLVHEVARVRGRRRRRREGVGGVASVEPFADGKNYGGATSGSSGFGGGDW